MIMRQQLLPLPRETERQRQHGDGYLAFKMNALVDKACIRRSIPPHRLG